MQCARLVIRWRITRLWQVQVRGVLKNVFAERFSGSASRPPTQPRGGSRSGGGLGSADTSSAVSRARQASPTAASGAPVGAARATASDLFSAGLRTVLRRRAAGFEFWPGARLSFSASGTADAGLRFCRCSSLCAAVRALWSGVAADSHSAAPAGCTAAALSASGTAGLSATALRLSGAGLPVATAFSAASAAGVVGRAPASAGRWL